MNLLELKLRTAAAQGRATVKIKVTGPVDADGCVEATCVETISSGDEETIVFSDENGEKGGR